MEIFLGAQPAGANHFAVAAVYWTGQWPLTLIHCRSYQGLQPILQEILGICGEWGPIGALAVAAPLTWSSSPGGWRHCDRQLIGQLPTWAPKTWVRAPNSLPGAVTVQGPALIWALAKEHKQGTIPAHEVIETHPRLCLANLFPQLQEPLLIYRERQRSLQDRQRALEIIIKSLTNTGLFRWQTEEPTSADELDAWVCALVACGQRAAATSGLVIQQWAGGEIRPVGRRQVALLRALP